MKTKAFNLGFIKMEMHPAGFPIGLILKRDLTVKECRHIMNKILYIDIQLRKDFKYESEYNVYNKQLQEDINDWLRGKSGDEIIMKYNSDYQDAPLGLINLICVLNY